MGKYIKKILSEVHPDTEISHDAVTYMEELFEQFRNLTPDETLMKIPKDTELYKYATKAKNQALDEETEKNKIIDYLTAELLELAGNCCRDRRRARIVKIDIVRAIVCDEELPKLFKTPTVPVISGISSIAIDCHGKYAKPLKKDINEIDENCILSKVAKECIYNILCKASNYYLTNEDINEKIKSLKIEKTIDPPIMQLHRSITTCIINKLNDDMCTNVNFDSLEEVVDAMKNNELDFLKAEK